MCAPTPQPMSVADQESLYCSRCAFSQPPGVPLTLRVRGAACSAVGQSRHAPHLKKAHTCSGYCAALYCLPSSPTCPHLQAHHLTCHCWLLFCMSKSASCCRMPTSNARALLSSLLPLDPSPRRPALPRKGSL